METMYENLLNGNLEDAKKQAKRFGLYRISDYLHEECHMSQTKALITAEYLKGRISWEEYCEKTK